jgi:hypothetical protein
MPRSAWDIILERVTPLHVHPCPFCSGKFECLLDCTIEPDLELDDGTPVGAYVCCSKACIYQEVPPEQLLLRDRVSD